MVSGFAPCVDHQILPPLAIFHTPPSNSHRQDMPASELLYFSVFVHSVVFQAVSLHSPGCPETYFVAQGGLKLASRPLTSASSLAMVEIEAQSHTVVFRNLKVLFIF